MYNAQFKTMFKLIAIDLMLLLVNFSYELVQQKCSYIASLGPRPVILSNAENDSNFTQWSDIWLFSCPNSHDKLAKSKFGSISINLNIVQNNMSIKKVVISGHYSHISQFTYKCIMWTVIINEDEEGRYVYRSEIWQALEFDFHK